jgi:hypothetical protein
MNKKKNISGKLQEIKKETPFSLPPGYFSDFQSRLQERISTEKAEHMQVKEGLHVPRLVWIGAVAAVFVIAIYISRDLIGIGTENPLSQEEIAYAFEQDIYDLDEFELVENIHEMDQDFETGNGYSEEIIMYLLDEDIEIDKIVSEL